MWKTEERKMDEKRAEDLARQEIRNARGNVRALSVILGLIAERYDLHRGGQFIRECVELKQIDELREKEMRALSYLATMMDGELYAGLVELLANDLTDDEVLMTGKADGEETGQAAAGGAKETGSASGRTGSASGRTGSASSRTKSSPTRTGSAPKKAGKKTSGAADGT